MTPTSTGRHCAACQQTVVDFTHQTDAEILAYLARAASTRICGRFAAGQLERPLQRAAPAAPTTRWRTFLAAVVAVWGVREGVGTMARGQAAVETRARYWGDPTPALPAAATKGEIVAPATSQSTAQSTTGAPVANNAVPTHAESSATTLSVVRGVLKDAASREKIPGATVLIEGTNIGISTDAEGRFELSIPPNLAAKGAVIRFSSIGYVTQRREVPEGSTLLELNMVMDTQQLGGLVAVGGMYARKPWPWHPRALFNWSRYQVMRPFRN